MYSTLLKTKKISLILGGIFMVGFEEYSDFRRTGLPSEIVAGLNALYSFIPYRLEYPKEEQTLNMVNYN